MVWGASRGALTCCTLTGCPAAPAQLTEHTPARTRRYPPKSRREKPGFDLYPTCFQRGKDCRIWLHAVEIGAIDISREQRSSGWNADKPLPRLRPNHQSTSKPCRSSPASSGFQPESRESKKYTQVGGAA
eukprot:4723230-Amphidinium_carterae.1